MNKKEMLKAYVEALDMINNIDFSDVCATKNIPYPLNVMIVENMIFRIQQFAIENGLEVKEIFKEPQPIIERIAPSGEITIRPDYSILNEIMKGEDKQ